MGRSDVFGFDWQNIILICQINTSLYQSRHTIYNVSHISHSRSDLTENSSQNFNTKNTNTKSDTLVYYHEDLFHFALLYIYFVERSSQLQLMISLHYFTEHICFKTLKFIYFKFSCYVRSVQTKGMHVNLTPHFQTSRATPNWLICQILEIKQPLTFC